MPVEEHDPLARIAHGLEARPVKIFLIGLIVLSVLPLPEVEERLRPVFLGVFGLEMGLRILVLARGRGQWRRSELVFLTIEGLAFISFLPLEAWFGWRARAFVPFLRLARLLLLLRFGRALARDVYAVLTRREQLQQFALVTGTVLTLAFVAAVFLSQLGVPHDYDALPGDRDGFSDRMWWAFRQLESADNLVQNLAVHPVVAVVSLGLTIMGVFVISYIIGIGANVVDQVVRAERRRNLSYRNHTVVLGAVHDSEVLVREFVRIYDKNRALRFVRALELWQWITGRAPAPRRHALPRMALLGEGSDPPAYLYEPGMRWVVYRQGETGEDVSLERVGAHRAKRVMVVASGGPDADAISLANLAAVRAVNPHAYVLVQLQESQNVPVVRDAGGPGTFALDVPRVLGLFLCHHLLVPGVDRVFDELLTSEGSEFYTHVFVDDVEQEWIAKIAGEGSHVAFSDLARAAYRKHGVVLVGVFLGEGPTRRLPRQLVHVDDLSAWLNPLDLPEDASRLRSLGARPGQVPLAALRGLIAVADSYLPVRRYARKLMVGDGQGEVRAEDGGGAAAGYVSHLRVGSARVRRVLTVGHAPALGALIRGLARFAPGIEVTTVLGARADAHTSLEARLSALDLGLEAGGVPGVDGREVALDRGGRLRVHAREGANLIDFAVQCLDGKAPVEAVAFLSDPESRDRDARTMLRVLRFLRALASRDLVAAADLHILVEIESESRADHLRSRIEGMGLMGHRLTLTLLRTDPIKNYFMVHSAFVPGVTELYERLLGSRDQELVRLELPPGLDPEGEFDFAELADALAPRRVLPISLELAGGGVATAPAPTRRFRALDVRAVYGVAESDELGQRF